MYYPHSIKTIRAKIYPAQKGTQEPGQRRKISHILWMLGEIENMNSGQSAKAGRWIGWILANMEFMKIISNEESRDMIRTDATNNND